MKVSLRIRFEVTTEVFQTSEVWGNVTWAGNIRKVTRRLLGKAAGAAAVASLALLWGLGTGQAARHDRSPYPSQPRYVSRTVTVTFEGPVSYGRVPTDEGWALRVDGAVASGGPGDEDWGQYDAIEFTCPPPAAPARARMAAAEAATDEGPINGPHQPFP